ncbi:MAG: respiratory nitrate reductase subunit gamma [bacterium]
MEGFSYFIGGILPFITIVVFIAGAAIRIKSWNRMPQPKVTLFPKVSDQGENYKNIAREIVFFKSLFRGDPALWFGSYTFHVALVLIFVGHVRVFTDLPRLWAAMGMSESGVNTMSATVGGAFGLVVLVAGLYLLIRRLMLQRVREVSSSVDYVTLFLLLAIILTGDAMRFLTHFELSDTRAYFSQLFTFRSPEVPQNGYFILHFLLAQILIMYLPLGKLLHIGGAFYTHSLIRKGW